MKKVAVLKCFGAVAIAALVTVGCATNAPVAKFQSVRDLGAPAWVDKGSSAFGGEKGKVFYGVASAANVSNPSLLRSTADNRARNEVAKVFKVYTASLMKDFGSSVSAGQDGVAAESQLIEQGIKTLTSVTLNGVDIVDHWQNPGTGELFALGRLDIAAFKDNLDRAKELNAKAKEYIAKNADRVFDELDKELAKQP